MRNHLITMAAFLCLCIAIAGALYGAKSAQMGMVVVGLAGWAAALAWLVVPWDDLAHWRAARLARFRNMHRDTAERLLRREVGAAMKTVGAHQDDPAALRDALADFYDRHARDMADMLHIPPEEARGFCRARLAGLHDADDVEKLAKLGVAPLLKLGE